MGEGKKSEKSGRRIWLVTATTNPRRAELFIDSWRTKAARPEELALLMTWSNAHATSPGFLPYLRWTDLRIRAVSDYVAVVPAFASAIGLAPEIAPNDIVVCLHDDVELLEQDWDEFLRAWWDGHPNTVLAGFFGARGLGSDDLYDRPYDPMQLARQDCFSNMRDAEAHGRRETTPQRAVVFDGFSQVMRGDFAREAWGELTTLGFRHHFYDGALGCLAAQWKRDARQGRSASRFSKDFVDNLKLAAGLGLAPNPPENLPETWFLPIACHHAGGMTAVGDQGYQDWARKQIEGGDQGFWEESHRIGYEEFRDVLPLRVEED